MALPPGCAKLLMEPLPTGSMDCANTIGTVRVACSSAGKVGPLPARMTSGLSATRSAAFLRRRAASPPLQRVSIRTFRPTSQPVLCSPCKNAASWACISGSSGVACISTPTSRTRSCARAASGHAAAPPRQRDELPPPHAPPLRLRSRHRNGSNGPILEGLGDLMSALGQKRTSNREIGMSALPSNSGHQADRLRCPLCATSGLVHRGTTYLSLLAAGIANRFGCLALLRAACLGLHHRFKLGPFQQGPVPVPRLPGREAT